MSRDIFDILPSHPQDIGFTGWFWGINLALFTANIGTAAGLKRGFDHCSVFLGIKIALTTNLVMELLFIVFFPRRVNGIS
jgi:hypothetical protein